MRLADLPQAIYRAIHSWRLWITSILLTLLIGIDAAAGIREGQTIVEALTRISHFKMALLLFVCGVFAQAGIGTIPFLREVTMTMIDFAQRRRQQWRAEGIEQGRNEGIEQGRAEERRRAIAAISADPELSDAAKLQAIIAINSAEDGKNDN